MPFVLNRRHPMITLVPNRVSAYLRGSVAPTCENSGWLAILIDSQGLLVRHQSDHCPNHRSVSWQGILHTMYWGGVCHRSGAQVQWHGSSESLLLLTPVYVHFPSRQWFPQVPVKLEFGEKKINEWEPWHDPFLEGGKRMKMHKIWSESDKYRVSYTSRSSVSFVRWPGTWRQADVSWRQGWRDN